MPLEHLCWRPRTSLWIRIKLIRIYNYYFYYNGNINITCIPQPPRQHPGWQLMQAVDWGPACPQPVRFTGATKGIRDMDEDCLYLNIFSPNVSTVAQAGLTKSSLV